jgi:uncharacterized CHY-type Zn-finger protein
MAIYENEPLIFLAFQSTQKNVTTMGGYTCRDDVDEHPILQRRISETNKREVIITRRTPQRHPFSVWAEITLERLPARNVVSMDGVLLRP